MAPQRPARMLKQANPDYGVERISALPLPANLVAPAPQLGGGPLSGGRE